MRKILVSLLCASLLVGLAAVALADPVISRNGYTAYLGESNYLYLRDPEGVTRVLPHPIQDLVAMNDTELFCLTDEGQLYGIMLDASNTRVASTEPTEDDLNAVRIADPYTLQDGILTLTYSETETVELSQAALVACINGDTLYYVESVNGIASLMAYPLDQQAALISATLLPRTLGTVDPNVISITATEDAVTLVKDDHSITAVNLASNSFHNYAATADTTTLAISVGTKLIRLHENTENGSYTVESVSDEGVTVTPTPAVTTAPTAAPTATATAKATATPKPTSTASSSSADEDDGRISSGATGSKVRKMQKQLAALGYPVGKIDGSFGPDTLRAVHLFQAAIGYKERSYASAAMLNKLYASNAPAYDRYAELVHGDKGEEVKILQEMLYYLGYLGKDMTEIDGKYGDKTAAAVLAFQKAWSIEPADGKATKATLEKLCELYDEFLTTGKVPQPTATPSPTPSATPTEIPSVTPPATEEATSEPTETPTAEPTDEPTEEPTAEPTEEPTTEPSDEPTTEPSEKPATSTDA